MYFLSRLKSLTALALISVSVFAFFPHTAHAAPYTVRNGDSLYTLGKLFNTSPDVIRNNSGLSGDTIYPGQVLDVPAQVYTVKRGDTLYLISKRNGITLYSLRVANNQWDNYIYPGEKLLIPGGEAAERKSQEISRAQQTSRARISYTAEDVDLLARLIMSEAENQPYNAMVGVGGVVINRVLSAEFAGTIRGVIYERLGGYYQFTPVENGWINRPASQTARQAAYDALHGSDPSNGALFYFDDSATNKWLWSKPLAARIGNMVYVY